MLTKKYGLIQRRIKAYGMTLIRRDGKEIQMLKSPLCTCVGGIVAKCYLAGCNYYHHRTQIIFTAMKSAKMQTDKIYIQSTT
jgi:hypothetical protein